MIKEAKWLLSGPEFAALLRDLGEKHRRERV